jgi:integrase/recombinase XerD
MGYAQQLPSGRWRARGRDPQTGKTVTFGKPYATEAAALVAAKVGELAQSSEALATFLEGGQAPAAKPVTFEAYSAGWLATHDGVKSTRDGYASQLRSLCREGWTGQLMGDISAAQVGAYMVGMREAGKSESTRRSRLTVLRMVCKAAVTDGLLPTDPTANIRKPHEAVKMAREVTPTEMDIISAGLPEFRTTFFRIMRVAGLRYSEAAALNISQITNGTILVDRMAERNGVIRPFTKSRHNRVVPILEETEAMLRAHYERYGRKSDGLLFVNEDGGPLTYRSTALVWRRAVVKAGIGGRIPGMHDLRHSFAHELADSGAPGKNVRDILGHADLKTTERYMGRADIASHRRWLAVAQRQAS